MIGILSTILMYMFISNFNKSDKGKWFEIVFPVITLISVLVFNSIYLSKTESELLQKDGLSAKGIILKKRIKKYKRSNSYYLNIFFIDKNKVESKTEVIISNEEYEKFRINDSIEIIYLLKNKNIAKVKRKAKLKSSDGVKRNIGINDIFKIFKLNSQNIGSYLLTFNPNWKFNSNEMIWENEVLSQKIKFNGSNKIEFISFEPVLDIDYDERYYFTTKYIKELKALDFKEVNEKTHFIYYNDDIKIKIQIAEKSSEMGAIEFGQKINIEKR
ncbi:MAG: hypothetical protein V4667_08655 [Bacteroidota bacterium]